MTPSDYLNHCLVYPGQLVRTDTQLALQMMGQLLAEELDQRSQLFDLQVGNHHMGPNIFLTFILNKKIKI